MVAVKKLRVGYAQGYCKQSANKGRFVITDAQLRKVENEKQHTQDVREGSNNNQQ